MASSRFDFRDQETEGPACFLLRKVDGGIGVCITSEKNGDIEVVLSPLEYQQLLSFLQAFGR
jgi:hypothetical protein